MLGKKQIWAVFLFGFKLGHKAVEITHNTNDAFGPGTANEHTVHWCFNNFCKGDKSLEDEERSSDGWLEVDNSQLRASSKLIPLQLHKNLPKNLMSAILWSFSIWSKLKRWKSSISGCLMSWLQIKKIVYTTTMNHFSIRSWCAMKSRFYTATGYEQLSGWTKKKLQTTSQSQTYTQKRVMVTLCWSAASLIHYSFLNPGETITSEKYAHQIDKMHQ